MITTVSLVGMRFDALVGVLDVEHSEPQPIEVDVSVCGPEHATYIDYRTIHAAVATVIDEGHTALLEDLCSRIVAAVRQGHDLSVVDVAVRKMAVRLPGPLAYAEVRLRDGDDPRLSSRSLH